MGGSSERAKPVLEVNATHPLTLALARRFADGPDKALVEDAAWLISTKRASPKARP